MNWETVKSDFEWDGSLRDLYVFDTSEADWDRFLDSLPTWSYQTRFLIDGEPAPLPDSASRAFEIRQRAVPLLQIDVGGIELCCHFFTDEEIELDLDPREINRSSDLDQLVDLMRRLGQVLHRPFVLTPENQPEFPIIRYDPISNEMAYVPPTGQVNGRTRR